MSHTTPNVALFIDADNISAHFVHKIIGTLSTHGNIIVRRVYANWSKPLAGWQQAITENAMVAIQQFDHLSGKNSSDMAMTVDVLEWLYTKNIDVFCLVSSDRDFTPLCLKLREAGKTVIGMGNQNSSKALVASCNDFHYLVKEQPIATPQSHKGVSSTNTNKNYQNPNNSKKVITLIHELIENKATDGWLNVATLGQELNNRKISIKLYGYQRVSDFAKALDDFEVKYEGTTYYIGKRAPRVNTSLAMINEFANEDSLVSVYDAVALAKDTGLTNAISTAIAIYQKDGLANLAEVEGYLADFFGITSEKYGYPSLIDLLKNLTMFDVIKQDGVYYAKDMRFVDEEANTNQSTKHENTKYSSEQLQNDTTLITTINHAIAKHLYSGAWAKMADVGTALKEKEISAKAYGYKNLSELLKTIGVYELGTKNDHSCVKHPHPDTIELAPVIHKKEEWAKPSEVMGETVDEVADKATENSETLHDKSGHDNNDNVHKNTHESAEAINQIQENHEYIDDNQEIMDENTHESESEDADNSEDEEEYTIDGDEFHSVVIATLDRLKNDEGWVSLTSVGSAIKKAFGVGSHDLGYRTFADFFANFEEYELQKINRIWYIRQR